MSTVDVDVVILSWNRTDRTIAAVESVQRQAGVSHHVWLVDQGSEQPGLERLRRWCEMQGGVSLIENGMNLGAPGGRNVGFRAGCAPTVVCIDNDVELVNPDALRYATERLAAEPGLGAVGFRVVAAAGGLPADYHWAYPESLRSRADEEFYATRFLAGGVAFRRAAIERVGLYDERLFFTWEETDLAYRLIQAGYSILYTPRAQVLHLVDAESRLTWRGSRFYYHMRNALFIEYKYWRRPGRLLLKTAGYLVRGVYSRVPGQSLRALTGFARMWADARPGPEHVLTESARRYVYENSGRYEQPLARQVAGKLFRRFSTS